MRATDHLVVRRPDRQRPGVIAVLRGAITMRACLGIWLAAALICAGLLPARAQIAMSGTAICAENTGATDSSTPSAHVLCDLCCVTVAAGGLPAAAAAAAIPGTPRRLDSPLTQHAAAHATSPAAFAARGPPTFPAT